MNPAVFKSYDIRGKVPSSLNEDMVRRIGYAYAQEFHPRHVVIGHDARLSGKALYRALAEGLMRAGVEVTGIGLCGTEEIYYAAFAQGFDGGIMVTGSHNPADENGLKLVRAGAIPVSGDSGLLAIRDRIFGVVAMRRANLDINPALLLSLPERSAEEYSGRFVEASFREAYIQHVLSYVDVSALKPLRIVADAGNGCAGPVVAALAKHLPFEFVMLNEIPDGTFPQGVPNPLLPENRSATSQAVVENKADFGLAWDGDFDRCFFYDASGRFIEGYYLVGLISSVLLADKVDPKMGERVIHDPRLVWNTREIVRALGGVPVESKTGHAFIKERMRLEDAIYGGEMSAHHYFRDFAYCDSGMIPWLLVASWLGKTGKSLAACVDESMLAFPCSGEINSVVNNVNRVIERVAAQYVSEALEINYIDGLSLEFENWRFNLRGSNTEPILRLNVETRRDKALLQEKTAELLTLIRFDKEDDR